VRLGNGGEPGLQISDRLDEMDHEGVRMRRQSVRAGLVALLLWAGCRGPAELPTESTDLFLAPLSTEDAMVFVGESRNLTDRKGYDNQPSFVDDDASVLYVSRQADRTEIFRYDFEQDKAIQLTTLGDRLYSPRQIPGTSNLSMVRVEVSGVRKLWKLTADGGDAEPILSATKPPTLYYVWGDANTVVICLDGLNRGPRTLHLADLTTGATIEVATNVGRSLNRIPGRNAISFVLIESPSDWWVAELDLDTRLVRKITRTVQGVEDHAWTPNGGILMARGAKLYLWMTGITDAWEELKDFTAEGLVGITRLAVGKNGDKLILVSTRR
jgi:hypothetical protein